MPRLDETDSHAKRSKTMSDLDDGLIIGEVYRYKVTCNVCQEAGMAVKVQSVADKVQEIASEKIILYKRDPGGPYPQLRPVLFLGLTCGCYAKFHRQWAHITDRRK
jgi:hypothetical protein